VVIKKLKSSQAKQDSLLKRFEQEAKILAQLQHPNIVEVYDYGFDGQEYYIVMEFIEGKSLEALRQEKKLPPSIVAIILSYVANALKYAHTAGVIHRDIKPSNILISSHGLVKLTDFGISRFTTRNLTLTQRDEFVGTPAYIAPEQIEGKELTSATDIFTLGIVLYHLLTGQLPFSGESNLEIIHKVLKGKYTPPLTINPQLPYKLVKITQACLRQDPSRRLRIEELTREFDEYFKEHELWNKEEELKNYLTRGYEEPATLTTAELPRGSRVRKIFFEIACLIILTALNFFFWSKNASLVTNQNETRKLIVLAREKNTSETLPETKGVKSQLPLPGIDRSRLNRSSLEGLKTPTETVQKPKDLPASCLVSIKSNYWAEVWINGERCGGTPLELKLPPGQYQLKLENKQHCYPLMKEFKIEEGEEVLELQLKLKLLPAYLRITLPQEAAIFVNDTLIKKHIAPGLYKVEFGKEGVKESPDGIYQLRVVYSDNQVVTQKIKLTPGLTTPVELKKR
jgi:serine/threonine protein kinase